MLSVETHVSEPLLRTHLEHAWLTQLNPNAPQVVRRLRTPFRQTSPIGSSTPSIRWAASVSLAVPYQREHRQEKGTHKLLYLLRSQRWKKRPLSHARSRVEHLAPTGNRGSSSGAQRKDCRGCKTGMISRVQVIGSLTCRCGRSGSQRRPLPAQNHIMSVILAPNLLRPRESLI